MPAFDSKQTKHGSANMSTHWIHRLLGKAGPSPTPPAHAADAIQNLAPPHRIEAPGVEPLMLDPLMPMAEGLPKPDWAAIEAWVASIPDHGDQAAAWGRCELAWLQHLRPALGASYQIKVANDVALLTTQDAVSARSTLEFVAKARQRIERTLPGLAKVPEWGYDIVIVFDDEDGYYHYAAQQNTAEGEFAFSSGMYLSGGCSHFITVKNQLEDIEPIIVHELTHALLGHLALPLWLDEGLAVNTEHRFHPPALGSHRGGSDAAEQHARHQRFWGPAEIQQFWSGDSFRRTDEGNELSYDLARILTEQFATDWESFRRFAREATDADGGAAAAAQTLGIGLGPAVCALLERAYTPAYDPNPAAWSTGLQASALTPAR